MRWEYHYTPEGWHEEPTNRLVPDWDRAPETPSIQDVYRRQQAMQAWLNQQPSVVIRPTTDTYAAYHTPAAAVSTPARPQLIKEIIVVPSEAQAPSSPTTDPSYEQLLADERIKYEALWQECIQLHKRLAELEHPS